MLFLRTFFTLFLCLFLNVSFASHCDTDIDVRLDEVGEDVYSISDVNVRVNCDDVMSDIQSNATEQISNYISSSAPDEIVNFLENKGVDKINDWLNNNAGESLQNWLSDNANTQINNYLNDNANEQINNYLSDNTTEQVSNYLSNNLNLDDAKNSVNIEVSNFNTFLDNLKTSSQAESKKIASLLDEFDNLSREAKADIEDNQQLIKDKIYEFNLKLNLQYENFTLVSNQLNTKKEEFDAFAVDQKDEIQQYKVIAQSDITSKVNEVEQAKVTASNEIQNKSNEFSDKIDDIEFNINSDALVEALDKNTIANKENTEQLTENTKQLKKILDGDSDGAIASKVGGWFDDLKSRFSVASFSKSNVSCPTFTIPSTYFTNEMVMDAHCYIITDELRTVLSSVMILFFSIVGFKTVFSA